MNFFFKIAHFSYPIYYSLLIEQGTALIVIQSAPLTLALVVFVVAYVRLLNLSEVY